jgi:hypothetical protein
MREEWLTDLRAHE